MTSLGAYFDLNNLNVLKRWQMVQDYLTQEEQYELDALKQAITYNPASISTSKMEQFTELLVKSLYGKGDGANYSDPTNYWTVHIMLHFDI